jgi:periplasmic protein TonB
MADQPVPFSSPRELAEPLTVSHSPTRSFEPHEPAPVRLPLARDLAGLREQLKTDSLDLDAVLDQIVRHAQILTGSNGAAVALRQGTVILCRARCGETSPSLGAQLDADFGISGECLRTGKALRCGDSERDLRLDPEVCRQLGLRSIAVVPIFQWTTVAGVLEVFAGQPHAFNDQHLRTLQQLAELVSIASGRVTQENQDPVSERILELTRHVKQEIPVAEANSYASSSPRERLRKWTAPIASLEYYAAAIAILALAGLLTILVWKPWREDTVVRSTNTLPNAAPMDTRPRLNIAEPAAVGQQVTSHRAVSPTASNHPSKPEAQGGAQVQPMSGKDEIKNPIVVPSVSTQTRDRAAPANAQEPLAPIQLIGTAAGFAKDANVVDSALSEHANLPVMVSQGVSGGLLERKVQPIYPAEVRSRRLQGRVVLEAVVDEVGKVRDLRTVSGNPILARAAMDAVRQWRYQPYRLNGQPVKVPTEITINFSLP